VEGSERELHLSLNTHRTRNTEVRRGRGCVLEQGRLSNTGVAVHHQHTTVTAPGSLEHAVQDIALTLPADQVIPWCPRDHPKSMPLG